MNAAVSSDFPDVQIVSENPDGSDSDSNADDSSEYYQPISAIDDEYLSDQEDSVRDANESSDLPNGCVNGIENGVNEEDEGSEDEEEIRNREVADSEIRRAFREDESRRNAPLTDQNASRVMAAMQGVSLGGLTPDWANRIPEDQWMDRLRRLRA
ncbi:uncharacterized protein LOC124925401 [Impatiens glandulifera]|uniref:uncharacterized protein LOC124925401 n=1 Tax=Impatiens glandulifera TaxID=253017 RepID=UPI001FB053F9|nr:uncharacterized protein LOC124925401 [Impatiens glandulifera]